MKTREVAMTTSQWEALRGHLLARPDREQLAMLVVAPSRGFDRMRLLVREILPFSEGAFQHQGPSGLLPNMEAVLPIVERCSRDGLGLLEAHSHPFDAGSGTTFSGTDLNNMWDKYPFLDQVLGGAPVGALVFGAHAVDGLLWLSGEDCLAPIHQVQVVGWPVQKVSTTFVKLRASRSGTSSDGEVYDRQVRAFGRAGQQRISELRVGIVGLGGIGSLLVEALCRLGVRDFVLVDPDVVEPSNLNRLAGAKTSDVDQQMSKVEIAARTLRELGWQVRAEAMQARFEDEAAQSRLKTVDVLFGGLDSHGTRLLVNAFATQYLVPYIDCGTGIAVGEGSSVQAIGGQVRIVMPDGPCLRCQGAIDPERASYELMDHKDQERHRARGYVNDDDVPAPSVMPLNMYAAATAVDEFMGLVTGYKCPTSLVIYDLLTRNATNVRVTTEPDCVTCGPSGARALGDIERLALAQSDQHSKPPALPGAGRMGARVDG